MLDIFSEDVELVWSSRQGFVQDIVVHIKIPVHQHIPESGDTSKLVCELSGENIEFT